MADLLPTSKARCLKTVLYMVSERALLAGDGLLLNILVQGVSNTLE